VTESLAGTTELTLPASRLSQDARSPRPAPTLGWFPVLMLVASLGLALVAVADARSRSMHSGSQTLFWAGLVLIYAPIVARLAHVAPGRLERASLVTLLGLVLYLVKVFRDPFGFTFADELVHAPNAEAILRTHHLYHANAILRVTPSYPGLESVTAALSSLSGLTTYGAGLVVIGVARVLIVLALFLLVERVLGSPLAGGLAVAVYAANSNFVFFSAQFSYESLALPLLVVVLFAYAEWRDSVQLERAVYRSAILLLILTITMTHHLTSYALALTLLAVALAYALFGKRYDSPRYFALFSAAAALTWLLAVARPTIGYLGPVITRAFRSAINTLSGKAAPRELFGGNSSAASGNGTYAAIGHAIAILSVLILVVVYPYGFLEIWRRHRRDPFAIVLALGAGLVFATYALRFAPDAWETANRSTEFLFLGLAFALPLGLLRVGRWLRDTTFAAVAAAALTVVFAGGVISGWSPSLRLSQPYEILAAGRTIPTEGRALASWAHDALGPNRRYAATDSDARLLNTYADGFARAGKSPDIVDILRTESLAPWQTQLLRKYTIRYVAVDLRERSFDNTAGYYFGFRKGPQRDTQLPSGVAEKFKHYDRIFDSGDIVVFDLGPR
jgi:hypothetical protein